MQVEFQDQKSLQSLKLELKKNANKANDQLSKSKLLVEQFQKANVKAKAKIKLLEEELEKVKDNSEKDTTAKVIELLQDRLDYKLGTEFKEAFPEYKVSSYYIFLI